MSKSKAELFIEQFPDKWKEILQSYSKEQLKKLKFDWSFWGRPEQRRPIVERDWDMFLLNAGRGFGKLACVETPIKTIDGWKKLGELVRGDYVFDEQGKPTKVLEIFDDIPDKAYRFHFDDSYYIDSCSEHYWATVTENDYRKYILKNGTKLPKDWVNFTLNRERKYKNNTLTIGTYKTTQEIVDTFFSNRNNYNHSIPNAQPLKYNNFENLIPEWIFGYLIGDGDTKATGRISSDSRDLDEIINIFKDNGYTCRTNPNDPIHFWCNELKKSWKQLNQEKGKHIPESYLYNTVEKRFQLLSGLISSDGSVSTTGRISFRNTNKIIINQICELIASLGLKYSLLHIKPEFRNGNLCKESWKVTILYYNGIDLNLIKRKQSRLRQKKYTPYAYRRNIVKFEEIAPKPMRCITVDSPKSMFLLGRNLIPTRNSRSGSEWVRFMAESNPGCRIGLVAPTAKDVRDIQVLGQSGLLSVCPPGSVHYERSKSRLVWKNGSTANMLSADEPDRIRGYNFHFAWFDEIFQARYEDAFDMLMFTLREGKRPQLLMTTTPRVNQLTFRIVDMINTDPINYKFQSGSSYENSFLPDSFKRQLQQYENTSLGQQEIHAVILREITGALFKKEWFKYFHQFDKETGKKLTQEPFYKRTVIAVDIATTKKKKSDFTAICVASEDEYGNYYVRHVEAIKASPNEWAEKVIREYVKYDADAILVEVNQGGDLVSENLRRIKHLKVSGKLRTINGQDLPIKEIRAYKGKSLRAEPVALLYERGKVIHTMTFSELESQMCTFTGNPNEKDDLLDCVVYAIRELSSIVETSDIFTPLVDNYRESRNVRSILM